MQYGFPYFLAHSIVKSVPLELYFEPGTNTTVAVRMKARRSDASLRRIVYAGIADFASFITDESAQAAR
jgi:hypothetical protein